MKKISIAFILLSVITFGLQIAGSAADKAADHVKPYGNLYFFFGGLYSTNYDSGEKVTRDEDLLYRVNNNSNLGFSFNYSRYNGVFELGIDDIDNDREVKIRKAYGEYKLDFMDFMIGQTWSPYVLMSNEAADYYRSKGFGAMYEDPTLQMKFKMSGFYLDIMKPFVPKREMVYEEIINLPVSGAVDEYQVEEVQRDVTTGQPLDYVKSFLPKTAIGFEYVSGNESLRVTGGLAGNAYYISDTENDVKFNKKWIYSYLAYLNTYAASGRLSVRFSGGFIVNPANYGITVQSKGNDMYYGGAAMAIADPATGKYAIKDTWSTQDYIEVEYAIDADTVVNAGYGFSLVKYPAVNTKKDFAMEYYANVKINLGGLIALTPAFSYRDYMKDMFGKKEGHDIYGGVLATVSYY